MTDHEHHHDHSLDEDHEGTHGMALGFRIIEEGGKLYLAEAEVSAYVDEPGELGVTLVFHPLDGIDPVDEAEDSDWPSWPIDIDDDLSRTPGDPIPAQFQAIVRQLYALSEAQLREYLKVAQEEAGEEDEE